MTVIDIGPGATNRGSEYPNERTYISLSNPSNGTGILDTMEVWLTNNASVCKVGTFYGSSTSYTPRDYESLGAIVAGAKRTLTGLNCSVLSSDYLGGFANSQGFERDTGGTTYEKVGDQFSAGTQTYDSRSDTPSIYATGATAKAPMQNAIPAVLALLMN